MKMAEIENEINDWTQINEEVARLVAQLPMADAACLAMALAGGEEATPELSVLITKLRIDQAQKPLLDFYTARNLNLIDELEGSLLDRVPCDETHDTLKAIVTGLYIGDQSSEFATLVTSFMLFVKLMELRYSERLRSLQAVLQRPDGGEGGTGGGAAAPAPAPVVVDEDEDDGMRM